MADLSKELLSQPVISLEGPDRLAAASGALEHENEASLASPAPLHLSLPGTSIESFVSLALGHPHAQEPESYLGFGPHSIHVRQFFYASRHSLALVNLKPVVPGHVLVVSRRRVPRLSALSPPELCDLWSTVQRVGAAVEAYHGAHALSVALQDGPAAGQTVPHLHVHVLPRHRGDLDDNDTVYDLIDASGPGQPHAQAKGLREGRSVAVDPLGPRKEQSDDAPRGSASDGSGGTRASSIQVDDGTRPSLLQRQPSLHGPASSSSSPIEAAVVHGRPLQVPMTRHPRSLEAMAAEADAYRQLFAEAQEEEWDPQRRPRDAMCN